MYAGILGKTKIQDECDYVFSISSIFRQETKKLYEESQNTIICLFFFHIIHWYREYEKGILEDCPLVLWM